jgi:molybdopterin converting factor subunit 1
MRVNVLYFAVLKDVFKRDGEELELPEGTTVSGLLEMLKGREASGRKAWDAIAVAVNREYARAETVLREGDEVALLPPVSGGL